MANFHTILRKLRNASGLSQQELADRLGIKKSAVNMYERGERQPNFEILEAIGDFFNVDIDYLLGRTDKTTILPETAGHYMNDDARELAEFMFHNPEYKVLFDASRKVKKEDIEFVKQMIDRMRGEVDDTGC